MLPLSILLSRGLSRFSAPILDRRIRQEVALRQVKSALDLGSGPCPRDKFGVDQIVGVDFQDSILNNVRAADLSMAPIPAGDQSVQLVTAFDFLEHIPRWERNQGSIRFPFLDLIDDVHRVLEPGGLFYSETPAFPMREAFQDPTHVNIVTRETFSHYISGPTWARQYGFSARFELLFIGWRVGHLIALMQRESQV